MTVPRKLVVAGLIIGGDGRILLTQRRQDQALPLKWEFPGGKIEPGEAPDSALARELAEEIGCEVIIGDIWHVLHHRYDDFELLMLVYPCRLVAGAVPQCLEVLDIAWVEPPQMRDFDILEADWPLVDRLLDPETPTALDLRPGV